MTLLCVPYFLSSPIPPKALSFFIGGVFLTVCAGQVAKKDNTAVFQEVCERATSYQGVRRIHFDV